MIGIVGIHHVQLACPPGSEDVSRGFYVDALGLREVPKPPALVVRGGVWFRGSGVELHLGVEADFRPARKAHPGLVVEGLHGLAERLGVQGIEVVWDDAIPGLQRGYVDDPHGNRILEPLPA